MSQPEAQFSASVRILRGELRWRAIAAPSEGSAEPCSAGRAQSPVHTGLASLP